MENPCLFCLWILLTSVLIQVQGGDGSVGCDEEERRALLRLRDAFNGTTALSSWGDGKETDCCMWERVKCDQSNRHVIQLSLGDIRLWSSSDDFFLNASLFLPFRELQNLSLDSNRIRGFHEVLNLSKLQVLDLSSNWFDEIPSLGLLRSLRILNMELNSRINTWSHFEELTTLKHLELLNFAFNDLSGKIPQSLGSLTSLRFLSFMGNDLISGSLKDGGLCKLRKLEELDLSSNEFQGKMPSCLGNMTSLRALILKDNYLIGTLPSAVFSTLTSLTHLSLSLNYFEGSFSFNSSFGNNSKLEIFELENLSSNLTVDTHYWIPQPQIKVFRLTNCKLNEPGGNLPSFLLKQRELRVLDLRHTGVREIFPTWLLINNSNLEFLSLAGNFLTGPFTYNNHIQSKNEYLSWLDVSMNQIQGVLPYSIGLFFPYLTLLNMSKNAIQGPIPMSFCKLKKLRFLDLSKNNFTETIPACLDVSSLRYLHLHGNGFTGFLPKLLSEASSLVTLDMRDNNLSGTLPTWISSLSNLRFLLLGGNQFQGSIPSQLCDLRNVSMLDLSSNHLSSVLPSCLHKLLFGSKTTFNAMLEPKVYGWASYWSLTTYSHESQLQIDIYFESEYMASDEEEEVEFVTKSRSESYKGSILKYMSGMDLSFNNFTGPIPQEIGLLSDIHTLNLSHNHFIGSIPTTFFNLKQIECLDLSHNRLNGQIPQDLIELNFLSIFSVAFNNLSGRIPDNEQFSTFDNSSYEGNPLLCRQLLGKSCSSSSTEPSSEPIIQNNDDPFKETFLWSFIASYIVAFIASIIVFLCCTDYSERLLMYVRAKFVIIFSF
ncbi:PREDICTED: leucine-rich repeat receptor-like protein kinase PXC2 [Ipomoea nil]|uniref:leucine-rich repeat receptor-like protein kinase PXC2 n=1 Tax=Ipomoea nil TaxID=35883 RepID=UPI0009018FAF|nr:PREDICTED: leucine-rich repeat receptor-like protein kinase PXC2 [Ipomoea nil]